MKTCQVFRGLTASTGRFGVSRNLHGDMKGRKRCKEKHSLERMEEQRSFKNTEETPQEQTAAGVSGRPGPG